MVVQNLQKTEAGTSGGELKGGLRGYGFGNGEELCEGDGCVLYEVAKFCDMVESEGREPDAIGVNQGGRCRSLLRLSRAVTRGAQW